MAHRNLRASYNNTMENKEVNNTGQTLPNQLNIQLVRSINASLTQTSLPETYKYEHYSLFSLSTTSNRSSYQMRKASNPDRFLRRKQVLLVKVTATLYRMMSKGLFPKQEL